MKNVTAELNAVPLEATAVFKNFLNNATHGVKLPEITLNKNKTNFYFPVFFISFLTSVPEQCGRRAGVRHETDRSEAVVWRRHIALNVIKKGISARLKARFTRTRKTTILCTKK